MQRPPLSAAAARSAVAPPLLQDDLGHAELGYHRPAGYKEVQTPIIDGLVKVGVNLDRFCETASDSGAATAIRDRHAPACCV